MKLHPGVEQQSRVQRVSCTGQNVPVCLWVLSACFAPGEHRLPEAAQWYYTMPLRCSRAEEVLSDTLLCGRMTYVHTSKACCAL